MHDIKSSTKYYLQRLGIFNEKYESKIGYPGEILSYLLKLCIPKGAPLDYYWGFVDCTTRPVCCPGQSQRLLHNGRKRLHCIKFQSIIAPNGRIANLFCPVEGK